MICIGFVSGLWIIGTVGDDKSIMRNPRMYIFSNKEHGIMNMPCDPPELSTERFDILYEATGDILDLYKKQVEQSVLVKPSTKIEVCDERGNIKLS